jgi:hypothetical protein
MQFTNREVEFPNRVKLTKVREETNGDIIYDLQREEGQITKPGTPLDANNLNSLTDNPNFTGQIQENGVRVYSPNNPPSGSCKTLWNWQDEGLSPLTMSANYVLPNGIQLQLGKKYIIELLYNYASNAKNAVSIEINLRIPIRGAYESYAGILGQVGGNNTNIQFTKITLDGSPNTIKTIRTINLYGSSSAGTANEEPQLYQLLRIIEIT